MQALNETLIALQGGSWWSGAGIVLVALVICCLVMMCTMRRGMSGKTFMKPLSRAPCSVFGPN